MTPAATVILLVAVLGPPRASEARGDPCRLLTAADIAAVAGGTVVERKSARRAAGEIEIADCFFRSEPFDSSVSLEVTRSAPNAVREARAHWDSVFHSGAERDGSQAEAVGEAGDREERASPREVEGVGDEAFWLSNPVSGALYVRREDTVLRISVGGTGGEAAQMKKATDLALRALGRI